jgi:hypothetical protein
MAMLFTSLLTILRKKYSVNSERVTDDGSFSEARLLGEALDSYQEDILYIGYAAQFQPLLKPPRYMICVSGSDAQKTAGIANMAVIGHEDFSAVMNTIQTEMNRSLRSEIAYAKMLRMILNGQGLSSILSEAARQFGNALVILDISGKILANSNPFNVSDPLWITSVERGYCPLDFMEHIKRIRAQNRRSNTQEAFISVCESNDTVYICSRILVKDELVGYVFMFDEEKKGDAQHREILSMISLAASEVMRGAHNDVSVAASIHSGILTDMLDGIDPVHASARIAASQMDFPERMRIMVVRPTYYNGENHVKGKIHPEMRRIFGNFPSVCYQGNVVQVVPLDSQFQIPSNYIENIAELAEKQHTITGVSNEFFSPSQFAQYQAQAYDALRIALRIGKSGVVHYYSDLAFYALLNQLPFELHLWKYCHPALRRLRKHDEENGTDLFNTLKIYTETGFSQKQTSEKLFLHRNTLNYRKQQIASIGDINFNNPEIMFSLIYSFQIDNYLQHWWAPR